MTYLDQIDFLNHDGVNRAMINDYMRNQFYDDVLRKEVAGKHCVDIGFGTGLLSMIALKYGAQSITAYESDPNRFLLGQEIIQRLQLSNKITLINKRFVHSEVSDDTVFFSETVNGNLWNEGLIHSLPRQRGVTFLPGCYFVNFYACAIPPAFAQGLIAPDSDFSGFNPAIDIDPEFVALINSMGFPDSTVSIQSDLPPGINQLRDGETHWGWIPWHRKCCHDRNLVASYAVDAVDQQLTINGVGQDLTFQQSEIVLKISTDAWKDQTVLLVPRAGLQHKTHQLYLDQGHWGPTQHPIILHCPETDLVVKHNVFDGRISYSM